MNDETRAALVRELVGIWDHAAIHYNDEYKAARPMSKHAAISAVADKIDRLLTTRAAPNVDDDAVERAAKALWDYRRMNTPWEPWEELREDSPSDSAVESKSYYRNMARAALAVAATAPGLDMEKIRLEAQVRYLKSRLISAEMRVEGVKGRGPEVVARIERIIGGIEGNMEVAAVEAERAVAQATTTQEGGVR